VQVNPFDESALDVQHGEKFDFASMLRLQFIPEAESTPQGSFGQRLFIEPAIDIF
jgi:hypothetical protein